MWKYLATSCKTQKGILQCPLKQEVKFGALNAHSRISIPVSLTFLGPDEVTIHGVQEKLSKIDLKSDSGDWSLWVNEQFKLIRILRRRNWHGNREGLKAALRQRRSPPLRMETYVSC